MTELQRQKRGFEYFIANFEILNFAFISFFEAIVIFLKLIYLRWQNILSRLLRDLTSIMNYAIHGLQGSSRVIAIIIFSFSLFESFSFFNF